MIFGECEIGEKVEVAGGGLETSPHPFRLSGPMAPWRLSIDFVGDHAVWSLAGF
jgi:hypothetical protein